MVVKIMRWVPWPPSISKKYEVKLSVQRLESADWVAEPKGDGGFAVEVKWKGAKVSLGSLRRTAKRDCTKRVGGQHGVSVEWNEQFERVCSLSGYKDGVFFLPWEISFSVLHMSNQGTKSKLSVIGLANLNLAEYASKTDDQDTEIQIPLTVPSNAVEPCPRLYISLNLRELLPAQLEPTETAQGPITSLEIPSASGTCSTEKDEVSALKAGLRKVKIFADYVSTRKAKKAREDGSEGYSNAEDGDYTYSFDSESLEETEEAEPNEVTEDSDVRKSFSYGTLAFANYAGISRYSGTRANNEDEDWIYYSSSRRLGVGCSHGDDVAVPEQLTVQNSRRSILVWRKRKLSFRSPKVKGEPLLRKAYAEEGGDDIDFDRRQLSSDESISVGVRSDEDLSTNCLSVSEFSDDSFVVGTWEHKEITSRDRCMKIQTEAFFASIDQRNERAAGESACTALVAVIADWLQNNFNRMPVKSQFDSLIRDGSLEWRNLCENETYKDRFPDKHFDLETVLNAKVRDICVVPGKSFVGFFHPDGMEEGNFEFLNSAMSFDSIWDEITSSESSNAESRVFIVSWNDHFFALKFESDAYYIIDTLGERLHEGCNQAYILKFDQDTTIYRLPNQSFEEPDAEQLAAVEPQNSSRDSTDCTEVIASEKPMKNKQEAEVVCRGKESCKDYIKSFLAAIPIRELQADIKKGLPLSKPLHHRLQIEFHFTQLQQQASSSPSTETVTFTPEVVNVTT